MQGSDDVHHVVFRVINWHPSRFKTVRSRGSAGVRKLSSAAVAVTFHDACLDDEGSLLVQLRPSRGRHGQASPVYILEDLLFHLHDASSLDRLKTWRGSGDVSDGFFAFPHSMAATCDVAQQLLEHHAYDADTSVSLWASDEMTESLRGRGLLEEVAGIGREEGTCKFHLTASGIEQLQPCHRLRRCSVAASVREEARHDLAQATTFELLSLLHEKGFVWQKMPPKWKRALGPTGVFSINIKFPDDQVGVWGVSFPQVLFYSCPKNHQLFLLHTHLRKVHPYSFASGLRLQVLVWYGTPRHHYLRCLLEPDTIIDKAGIEHLPHDRREGYYQKLFAGVVLADPENQCESGLEDDRPPPTKAKRPAPTIAHPSKHRRLDGASSMQADAEGGDVESDVSMDSSWRELAAMMEIGDLDVSEGEDVGPNASTPFGEDILEADALDPNAPTPLGEEIPEGDALDPNAPTPLGEEIPEGDALDPSAPTPLGENIPEGDALDPNAPTPLGENIPEGDALDPNAPTPLVEEIPEADALDPNQPAPPAEEQEDGAVCLPYIYIYIYNIHTYMHTYTHLAQVWL